MGFYGDIATSNLLTSEYINPNNYSTENYIEGPTMPGMSISTTATLKSERLPPETKICVTVPEGASAAAGRSEAPLGEAGGVCASAIEGSSATTRSPARSAEALRTLELIDIGKRLREDP
jgi:hypothetical protein